MADQNSDLQSHLTKFIFYKQIVENSYDWVVFRDHSGKIIYLNDSFERVTGFKKEELLTGKISEKNVVHPDDFPFVAEKIKDTFEHILVDDLEFRVVRPNGEIRFVILNAVPVFDNRQFIGTCTMVRDVTDSKILEDVFRMKEELAEDKRFLKLKQEEYEAVIEELRELNEQLLQAKEHAENAEKLYKEIVTDLNKAQSTAKLGSWKWYIQENRVEWSDEMYAIFGVSKQNFTGNLSDVIQKSIHPDDIEKVTASNLSVSELGKPIALEYRIITEKSEEKVVWAEAGELIYDKDKKPFLLTGIVHDITERKRIENLLIESKEQSIYNHHKLKLKNDEFEAINNELIESNEQLLAEKQKAQDSEQKYRAAFYTSPDSVNINKLNGEYVEINEGFTRLTGYTEQDVIGKTSLEINIWHSPDDRKKLVEKLKSDGLFENLESVFKAKDGTLIPALMSARLIHLNNEPHILSVTRAITERKNFEMQLQAAKERAEAGEKRYQSYFEQGFDGVVIIDVENATFIEFNDQVCKQLEYTRDEFKQLTIFEIDAAETQDETIRQIQDIKTHGRAQFETKHRTKTGKIRDVLISSRFIATGENRYIQSVWRDITEQKKYQEELIRAKEHAEESDQLKTAFLHNLSHEIRTPLNAICGFSHALNKSDLTPDKRHHFSIIIQDSANQLLSIVENILTVSSLETHQEHINIDKTNVNDILREQLAIFNQNTGNQNISIYSKIEIPEQQALVYTDKTKLTQILSNLIANSVKFTHEGFIEFGCRINNDMLEFFVRDTGIGIDYSLHDKIFERFRQADSTINKNYGGTGLGLSISKGFVELLGGKIQVESVPGSGSVFIFTIPYKSVQQKYNSDATKIHFDNNKKTVLVAEDETFNYLYIEELLSDLNVGVLHAKDGQEAINIARQNPQISLIIMDIKMPILDGYEASKIILQEFPDIRIIAQSAYALENEIERFSDVFDHYIVKPIDEDNFYSVVKNCLNIEHNKEQ